MPPLSGMTKASMVNGPIMLFRPFPSLGMCRLPIFGSSLLYEGTLLVEPVFSVCEEHGYLAGEQPTCPHCGRGTNVWTRVMGYHRPVASFNRGKKGEHKERQHFSLDSIPHLPLFEPIESSDSI